MTGCPTGCGRVTIGFGAAVLTSLPPREFSNDPQSLATVQIIDLAAPKATLIRDTPPAGQNGWSRNQSNRPTPPNVARTCMPLPTRTHLTDPQDQQRSLFYPSTLLSV